MKFVMVIFVLFFSGLTHAEIYSVTVGMANLRSSADFSDKANNVARTVTEGTQLDLVADHGDYIEVKIRDGQLNAGEKGFIKKNLVEDFASYDGVDKDTGPSLAVGQPDMPLCACHNCRRSSRFGIRTHPISGRRRLHTGCDIAAPKGTLVHAAAAGVVKFAGRKGGYGNAIDIEHRGPLKDKTGKVLTDRGYTTRYGHLWKILVGKGQRVDKGQVIGKVDSTGASTGHHLHFEIATPQARIDPERIVNIVDAKNACAGAANLPPANTDK